MEDIKLDNLIINKLTKAQYDSAEKSENELYAITDEEFYTKSEVEQFVKENVNCFTITEDKVTVERDATKGTAPYSTAYGYTNITINDNNIAWKEGAIYVFVVNTAMAVQSAYRNVRVRIGKTGDWKPMMDTSAIMNGSSFMVMGMNTNFQYKTVYQSTGALHRQTDTNTTYTLNQLMNQSIYVSGTGSYAISRYSICMQKPDLTWEKLTDTSQGYSQATTKTANTSGFLLNLRYYNTTADLGNGSKTAVNTMCSQYYDVHLNYSTNCGTKHNQQTGTPVFIVGSIGEDGLFYLDTTQWWSYALPTTNDGKLYIYIGTTINTSDSKISFEVNKPIYYHNGTKICEYKVVDNKQDVITDIDTIRSNAENAAKQTLENITSEGEQKIIDVANANLPVGSNIQKGIVQTDNITIESNGGVLTSIATKTKSNTNLYDWVGTEEEYNTGVSSGIITGDTQCIITDDEQELIGAVELNVPTKVSDLANDSNFVNKVQLDTKQDKLTAGVGIKIENNTISTTCGWGDITGNIEDQEDLQIALNNKQDNIVSITKAEYDQLEPDPNTYYAISDDTSDVSILEIIYPVGSLYLSTNETCPLSNFFGTWELIISNYNIQDTNVNIFRRNT